jgi:hypothetical protein
MYIISHIMTLLGRCTMEIVQSHRTGIVYSGLKGKIKTDGAGDAKRT